MIQTNQVYKTNDYDTFSYIKGNRSINKLNLKRITNSMRENYIPVPIIVNEKNQIIDGQHRFEAAKYLKKEVYCIKIPKLGLKEVTTLNTNTANWNNAAWLESYVDLEVEAYVTFKEFRKKTGFGYSICSALLANQSQRTGTLSREFKDGKLKIKSLATAYANAKKLDQIGEYFENYKSDSFSGCMLQLMHHEQYDHTRMLQKLKLQAHTLPKSANGDRYKRDLIDIFNYHVAKKNKAAFF